jgi:phosphopantothenoylcysteine decarboxylase / phosphopantothenate---cysteine ligase
MNQQMYRHAATQANLATLAGRGSWRSGARPGRAGLWRRGPGPNAGADGAGGRGRASFRPQARPLAGVKLMLTAGPTREALDPVRFISNHSSGKMGFALAAAARELGAEVTLVSGPVGLPTPAGVARIEVESARQMHQAVMEHIAEQQIFIACAAVADYAPKTVAEQKIKKTASDTLVIELTKNPDIVAEVAALPNKPFTIGICGGNPGCGKIRPGQAQPQGAGHDRGQRCGQGRARLQQRRQCPHRVLATRPDRFTPGRQDPARQAPDDSDCRPIP